MIAAHTPCRVPATKYSRRTDRHRLDPGQIDGLSALSQLRRVWFASKGGQYAVLTLVDACTT
jgi:hypothetical protein